MGVDDNGKLWLLGDHTAPRQVPPLRDRKKIMEQTFKELGYPSGQRLYMVLKGTFAWNGMYADCVEVAK